MGEDSPTIHSYLKDYDFKSICLLNSCCPMVKPETIDDMINTFEKYNHKSLFTVKENSDLIFDANKKLLNNDRVFNSKLRNKHYIGNNVACLFSPDYFFKHETYWTYTPNDPYLFEMDHLESYDIDTEEDFKIAQAIYQSLCQKQT